MALVSTLRTGLSEWGGVALNLIFPRAELIQPMARAVEHPYCRQCGQPFPGSIDAEFECYNCGRRKWSLAWARGMYQAEGGVREAIHAFKYDNQFHWLGTLAGWLDEGFERHAMTERWDALIPVPLFHRRRRDRGFNQSDELARVLGARRGIPVWRALKRTRETASQAGLLRAARLRNIRGAFETRGVFDLQGLNLLLIDDVFTTGATMDACARVLRHRGAARVAALTIARG